MNCKLSLMVCLLVLLTGCKTKTLSNDPLTATLPREEARYDIRFYRELLDDAHPSLNEFVSEKRISELFDSITVSLPKYITLRDLYNKLSFICNEIGCSHTSTDIPPAADDSLYKRKLFFPFQTILIGNRLYVNTDELLDHGTRILSINGMLVTDILDSLSLYNPMDGRHRATQRTAAAADFGYQYFLRFGCPGKFIITTQEGKGKTEEHVYEPITLDELNEKYNDRYYFDSEDVTYYFKVNEDYNYALLRLTDFDMGTDNNQSAYEDFLKNSFELLYYKKNIRSLIIDLRGNTGGWLYNCFLLYSYLSGKEFREYQRVYTRLADIPYKNYLAATKGLYDTAQIMTSVKEEFLVKSGKGYIMPDSLIKEWKPDKFRFSGQVYIITNHAVASAASYFTFLAKKFDAAKVVGVETAGGSYVSNGFYILKYQLPQSGIRVQFPFARLQYTKDSTGRGYGVLPDYDKPDTWSSFEKNEDLQIKFIVDSILSKNR